MMMIMKMVVNSTYVTLTMMTMVKIMIVTMAIMLMMMMVSFCMAKITTTKKVGFGQPASNELPPGELAQHIRNATA